MAKKSNQTAVKIDNDLIKLLDEYGEIIGNPNRAGLLRAILWDFFNGLDFNNEFIELDAPLYFNWIDKYGEEIMETYEDIDDIGIDETWELEHIYQLNKIPLNLDEYDIDNGCYCYKKDITQHRGVYLYVNYGNEEYLPYELHLMDIRYDVIKNKAYIKRIPLESRGLYIDNTIYKKTYDEIESKYIHYSEMDYLEDNFMIEDKPGALLESYDVIESYIKNTRVKHHLSKFGFYGDDSGFTMRSMLEHSKPVKRGWINIYQYLFDLFHNSMDTCDKDYYNRLNGDIKVSKQVTNRNKQ